MLTVSVISVIRSNTIFDKEFGILRDHVEKTLKRSAFQNVKLADVFRKMIPTTQNAAASAPSV